MSFKINFINKINYPSKQQKIVKKLSLFFIILIIVIFVIFYIDVNTTSEHLLNNSLLSFSGLSSIIRNNKLLVNENSNRTNFLILGIRGDGDDGPLLADSIILASFKPTSKLIDTSNLNGENNVSTTFSKQGQIALLSIPRDLYVPHINEDSWQKINHLDVFGEQLYGSKGGIKLTKQVVEKIFEQPIDYWLRVNFEGFKKVIDLLGGIEIDIDRSFTDNFYPAPNSQFQSVSFHSGEQTMDGKRALQFVRSRHGNNGEGSDFARAARQQKVILAVEKKIVETNLLRSPHQLWTLFSLFNQYVETNISWLQIISFSKIIKDLDSYQVIQKVLKSGDQQPLYADYVNGAYVLKVKNDDFGILAKIAADIFSYSSTTQITNEQENLKKNNLPFNQDEVFSTKIVVLNGTNRNGLASDLSAKIKAFDVVVIANASPQNYQQTNFYATNLENSQISQTLEKQLGIKLNKDLLSATNLPDSIKQYQTKANYVIIIGNDYVK